MGKHERDRVAVGEKSSKGEHGGNRSGGQEQDKEKKRKHSNPSAGNDPDRGGRP